MDEPGAFATKNKTKVESENSRRMQTTMRKYMSVAALVDREVMKWDALPTEQQNDMDEVIKNLNMLADISSAGDVATEAQFVLGVIYENGRGMSKPKYDRAAELYQTAAEGGCTEALYNLGSLTRIGVEGVRKDLTLAFGIYETAAHQEHVNSAYNLGVMYANGEGVPVDAHAAERWFLFAACRGHKEAAKNLEVLDKHRNVKLAFVLVATIALGFVLVTFLTRYGGDFFKAILEDPVVTSETSVPNPGYFSSSIGN